MRGQPDSTSGTPAASATRCNCIVGPAHGAVALALTLAFASVTNVAANGSAGTPAAPATEASTSARETMADVIAAANPADWRRVEPANMLLLDLAGGQVVIELAPEFAPAHVANIRKLARQRYWDGLPIVRVQENYVVQWGDPAAGSEAARNLGEAQTALPAEFDRAAEGLAFTRLPDGDVYAPQVGWVAGFPAARDAEGERAWMTHCYAAVGAGRGDAADSSTGTELYVVIGHSPRHLDRNITLVGRVLKGMEHLTVLPRGTGAMGFHEDAAQRVPMRSIRLGSDVAPERRPALEVLRTDTPLFDRLVASRRHRHEPWFIDPVGRVELCNVPIPVRSASAVED